MTTQDKGWGFPALARKAHYFVGSMSLCRHWWFIGQVDDTNHDSIDNCATCKRLLLKVKPQAQDSASEGLEPVPAPTTRRELRLLCLLVPSREGSTRSLPVHTMQPLPPRARLQGLIDRTLASEAGFHLRETQATAPTASVLELCLSKLHLRANGRVSVLGVTA